MSNLQEINSISSRYSTQFFEHGAAVRSIANVLIASKEADTEDSIKLSPNDEQGLLYALRQLGYYTVETTGEFDQELQDLNKGGAQ